MHRAFSLAAGVVLSLAASAAALAAKPAVEPRSVVGRIAELIEAQ